MTVQRALRGPSWRSRRGLPILLVLAVALIALALVHGACGSGTAEEVALPAPDLPGPFPVGVTTMTFERNSTTTGESRPLETDIWYPAAESARELAPDERLKGVVDAELTAEGRPLPVVIFSHGSGGVPAQSTFLTAHLASHGFVVAAPSHPGNTALDCFPCQDVAGLVDSAMNRPDDISFTLDELLALNAESGSMFFGALDPERVGMSGHSFGGLTTIIVVPRDDRFRAALAMAPPSLPFVDDAARQIDVPTLIMGGGVDNVTPAEGQRRLFEIISEAEGGPDLLLILPRAGHLAFADVCLPALPGCVEGDLPQARAHDLINLYATSFLKTYVALDDRYASFLDPALVTDPDVVLVGGE